MCYFAPTRSRRLAGDSSQVNDVTPRRDTTKRAGFYPTGYASTVLPCDTSAETLDAYSHVRYQ